MDTEKVNNSAKNYDELDLPPEYCRYENDGCELANLFRSLVERS